MGKVEVLELAQKLLIVDDEKGIVCRAHRSHLCDCRSCNKRKETAVTASFLCIYGMIPADSYFQIISLVISSNELAPHIAIVSASSAPSFST